jgi:hypothetical protein
MRTASFIRVMMEAVHTSETSVYCNETISQKALILIIAAVKT